MSTYQQKLDILKDMIAFARADEVIRESEYRFLSGVAQLLGIDKNTFDSLFHTTSGKIRLPSDTERILHFHRLLLLMNIDEEQHLSEISRLHNIGLALGLPPSGIDQALRVMHRYPDKIIPPEVLLSIFRSHYN